MTHSDYFMTFLALWREARAEGSAGMTAVACVIRNRVNKRGTTFYLEVTEASAFSSITAKGDPQLGLYPLDSDAGWQQAQIIAGRVIDEGLADVTGGATLYWNPDGIKSDKTMTLIDGSSVAFPESWNPQVVKETVRIGAHVFLKEAT